MGEALCSGYVIPTNLLPLMYLEKTREHKEACPIVEVSEAEKMT